MQTLTHVDRDPVALDTESPSVESPVLAFRRLNGELSAAGLFGAVVGAILGLLLGVFTSVPLVPAITALAMYTGLVVGGTASLVVARRRRLLTRNAALTAEERPTKRRGIT